MIVAVVLVIAGIGAAIVMYGTNKGAQEKDNIERRIEQEIAKTAWVEVVRPGVYMQDTPDGIKNTVESGDIINSGAVIETDQTGKAVLHFPDGSNARLDSSARLEINEVSYDPDSQTLIAKMSLATGALWSKIFNLATPESSWQVKTANAVATVRGTAFGVKYSKGSSHIIGSQHTINVQPIKPKDKHVLEGVSVDVSENQQIVITDQQAQMMQAMTPEKARAILKQPTAVSAQEIEKTEWIREGKQADEQFERLVQEIRKNVGESADDKKTRTEIRATNQKQFEQTIRDRIKKKIERERTVSNPTEPAVPMQEIKQTSTTQATSTKPVSPVSSTSSTPASSTPSVGGTKLIVTTKTDLTKDIFDGATISFSAIVAGNDGTRQDVTQSAVWTVVGSVGTFEAPGKFQARVSAEALELEKAPGAIVASWKDPKSGVEVSSKSPIFYVLNMQPDTSNPPPGS
ncbi:MAG: FecR protein [Candidatus Parcubacteria bacterium]